MAVHPMFPLGTVLMPSVVLPLHVFEERYRVLTRHCLDGDGRFGVVLIERGSEVGGGDVRTDAGTMAQIVEAARFADGRFALTTVGRERIRVHAWLPDDPYPRADIEPWPDPDPGAGFAQQLDSVVALLRRALARHTEAGHGVAPATTQLDDDPVVASYQAAALAPLGAADKHRLLCAPTPEARVDALRSLLEADLDLLDRLVAIDTPPPDDPSQDDPPLDGTEGNDRDQD